MKKSELGKLLCIKGMLLVSSAALAESNEYLSSWWHQSVNVVYCGVSVIRDAARIDTADHEHVR